MGKSLKFVVIFNILLVIVIIIFAVKFVNKAKENNINNLKLETLYSEWYSADSTTKIKIKQDMLREWKDFKSENISDLQIKFWFNHDIMKNEQKTIN